jgi:hypothetical protein
VLVQRQLQCSFGNFLLFVVTAYIVSVGSETVEHMSKDISNFLTAILNKQSRTADKGWSSSLGVGRGAKKSSP